MKLQTKTLREAYKIIGNIGVVKGVSSSEYVRLKVSKTEMQLTLAGQATATATVKGKTVAPPKTYYLERRGLSGFINAAGDQIELEFDRNAVKLTSGTSRATLQSASRVTGYAETANIQAKQVSLSKELRGYIHELSKHVPAHPGSGDLKAVYVSKIDGVLVSDGILLLAIKPKTNAKITLRCTPLIASLINHNDVDLLREGSTLIGRYPSGEICETAPTELKDYPIAQLKKILKETANAKTQAEFPAGKLQECCKYFSRFAFGITGLALIEVGGNKSRLDCKLDFPSGQATHVMPATKVSPNMTPAQWPLSAVTDFANTLEAKQMVKYQNFERFYRFTSEDESEERTLILTHQS